MNDSSDNITHQLTLEEYQAIEPAKTIKYPGGEIIFCTPTTTTNWRAEGFFENEPETLSWIDGFDEDDVMFDVGANVGTYSLWAAKTRKAKVFAIEPEALNFAILNKNIFHNKIHNYIAAYCLAVSDGFYLDHLNLSSFSAGNALHGFGKAVTTVDALAEGFQEFTPAHVQGSVSMSIDQMVDGGFPVPKHIKVDIDGYEDKVIKGAEKTLEKRETASLLIETNQNMESHLGFVSYLEGLGYSIDDKDAMNYIFRR